jgi:preprotein translocase subunit SecA
MLQWFIRKVIGSRNQRELKKIWPVVKKIVEIEASLQTQPATVLREKTALWQAELGKMRETYETERRELGRAVDEKIAALPPSRDRSKLASALRSATGDKESDLGDAYEKAMYDYLDRILPEAYAVVKNAARRLCGQEVLVCGQPLKWDMVHFDVQLVGGIALHRGRIAEMATGEGKTLVGTLPVFLNALTGRGVHVITVNDYLAKRDAEWMGHLYGSLGLTVGIIQNDQPSYLRREQYQQDITYGTNSEFGFDYLRDNGMADDRGSQVQRGHYFAIVDEVDSVLIDEARTPLIISGPVDVDTHQYDIWRPLIDKLVKEQTKLLTTTAVEAKELAEKKDYDGAGFAMFKVKLGNPRHPDILRLMEDPDLRRAMDKAELTFYQDPHRKELFALKETLFYSIDEKSHEADLSEKGRTYLDPNDPDAFTLPDLATGLSEIEGNRKTSAEEKAAARAALQEQMDSKAQRSHNISQLLRAYCLYEKDVHYVVEPNEQGELKVMIVDEHTGRKMAGRRWSDGLHQAVEAKEGVQIDKETQTLATITIQNYFRLYQRLAGMTGTAETDAAEFRDIYALDLLVIPTNQKVARTDLNDKIYKTQREKYQAALTLLQERHEKGQPILVGTASVEASEFVSRNLTAMGVSHEVLNAKQHQREAEIIAKAGQRGAVTVSTNMAGRGTDIKLGAGIPDLGGLLVLATERHESRRIDRQLRGRCARQGDPGESIFFISFEDKLMRNFGNSERMIKMMERFGLEDGQELEHPWLNRSVESAQKKVEQMHYTYRKRVLEYDDVMNKQREVVYGYRNDVLETEHPREMINDAVDSAIPEKVLGYLQPETDDAEPDYDGLLRWVNTTFPLGLDAEEAKFETRSPEENADYVKDTVRNLYLQKMSNEGPDAARGIEKGIVLRSIDHLWRDHLYAMDGLREGSHWMSMGQKDPLIEYKKEAYELFESLMGNIKVEILANLFRSYGSRESYESFIEKLREMGLVAGGEEEASQRPAQPRPPQIQPSLGTGSGGAGPTVSFGSSGMGGGGVSFRPMAPKQPQPE